LDNTVAFLEVKVTKAVDVATYTLFIGEIVDCQMIDETKTVMTRSYYLDLKQNTKKR
jgi:flavin reductase (DIM6/NTAB) family NADH-FMN oxidoreductase RutF